MEVTGIILAGGKSTRMGQDKGLLEFKGKPLISQIIDAVKPLTDELIIIANDQSYSQFGYSVYPDLHPNTGPLGGICTGLNYSQSPINFVLSCDTPFVGTALLKHLLKHANHENLAVCYTQERMQPLVGIYGKPVESQLLSFLKKRQLALTKAVGQISHQRVMIHEDLPFYKDNLFFNINRPEDLEQARYFSL